MDAIADIGRTELADTAELGVSELVTNAVLHATDPITVRVRGTQEHPRVEVRDGSTEPPVMPIAPPKTSVLPLDEDELLLTFGRGLDIVARCADAWGAEIEENGKVMWFAPASDPTGRGRAGQRQRTARSRTDRADAGTRCRSSCSGRRSARWPSSRPTTASCAARCGCWRWPTRRSTRSPSRWPTCSVRCSARCRRGWTPSSCCQARDEGVDERRPRGAGVAVPGRDDGPVRGAARLRRRRSAASSRCCRWPVRPQQVRFQTWFFTEFARQGSGRSARARGSRRRGGADRAHA